MQPAVGHNRSHDLSPLAGLRQSQGLWVFGNGMVEVAPLQNFTALRSLSLGHK